MSLRAFHLLFIALSIILTVFLAVWAGAQYQSAGGTGFVLAAVLSLACGVALTVYGTVFQRKTRRF